MAALGENKNVYDAALEVLRSKGYRIWYDAPADTFCAEKDGWDFMADAPTSLLGLVAMFEHIKPERWEPYWWKLEGPVKYRSMPTTAPEYVPVYEKK